MDATGPPALPNVPVMLPPGMTTHLTVGAVVVSTWCSVLAMGVLSATAWVYFQTSPKDLPAIKMLVAGGLIVSLIDTGANMWWCYDWTVSLWGSIPGAGKIPIGFYINIFCCSTATSIVHSFYSWRLYLISNRNWPLCAIIILCAISQQSVVIWALVKWGSNHASVAEMGIVEPGSYGWIIATLIGDTIITGAMFYYLYFQTRSVKMATRTRRSFNSILSRTFQTNIFSLISMTSAFVLFRTKVGFYFVLNDVLICKVSIFAMVVSLNARRSSGYGARTFTSVTDEDDPARRPTTGSNGTPVMASYPLSGTPGVSGKSLAKTQSSAGGRGTPIHWRDMLGFRSTKRSDIEERPEEPSVPEREVERRQVETSGTDARTEQEWELTEVKKAKELEPVV